MEGRAPMACVPLTSETQVRPVVHFPPDIWANRFASIPSDQKEVEWYDGEVELLKNKTNAMLMDKSSEAVETIKLIDLLSRLGLAYHFQSEIEKHLYEIFNSQPHLLDKKDYDLHTIAVVFRVFRQHGHKISCDVFSKFKDSEKGKFKGSLTSDLRGLLSMFEASHLSTHGEDILEEALTFAMTHLEAALARSKPDWADEISSSLKIPLHKGPPRLKAKEFICFYEKCNGYSGPRNDVLLYFAKMDFNRIQLLHQQEIRSIYKWSKDKDLISKLPFARDRIMEYFFWSETIYSEPRYAYARAEYIKQCNLVTILDDVYDTHGAFDELPILNDAMERWDRTMIDQLPREYMKYLYKVYLDTFDELENHDARDGTSMAVSLTRDSMLEMARIYMLEAEWIKSGYIPTFEESLENGLVTAGIRFVHATAFMGMGELGVQAIQWLKTEPLMAQAVAVIGRLANELVSHKREEETGNATSPFSCYKREHKLSDEETSSEFKRRISDSWKTVNEELMRESAAVSVEILTRVVNFARLMEEFYKGGDGITDGKTTESCIRALYVDPIHLYLTSVDIRRKIESYV